MSIVKIILIVFIVLCLVPSASAAWFNETIASTFNDVEAGGVEFVLALFGLCFIYSVAATLIGHFGHRQSLFKSGISGFGVIILIIILYALAISIGDYFLKGW